MIRTGKTWRKTIVIARQPDIGSYKVIPSGLHFSHWRCAVNIQRSSPSLLGSSCHFTLSNCTTAETYAPVHRLHRSQTNNNPLPMGNTIGRIMRYSLRTESSDVLRCHHHTEISLFSLTRAVAKPQSYFRNMWCFSIHGMTQWLTDRWIKSGAGCKQRGVDADGNLRP